MQLTQKWGEATAEQQTSVCDRYDSSQLHRSAQWGCLSICVGKNGSNGEECSHCENSTVKTVPVVFINLSLTSIALLYQCANDQIGNSVFFTFDAADMFFHCTHSVIRWSFVA